jgi:ABC-2 type transport system permease protein
VAPGAEGRAGEAAGRVAQDSIASTIHDIGYRRYGGARLGRGYAVRSLFVQSLKGTYGLGRPARSKVMPMLLLAIMALPALIMVVVTILTQDDSLPLNYIDYVPAFFLLVSIFVASQSPQMVSRDLRFRLVPLYFSRPITTLDYVLAKYAAMTAALWILMATPLLVLYAGALLAELPPATQTKEFLMGLVGAAFFALVLAGVGLTIASATPRRGFGIAAIITVILVSYIVVSIVQGIMIFEEGNSTVAMYAELFTPFNLVNSFQLWLFSRPENETFPELPVPEGFEGVIFAAVLAATVVLSIGFLLWRCQKMGRK